MLTLFIAGLLFICALSTSITWERTTSRPETGLLIPSDYNNQGGAERPAELVAALVTVSLGMKGRLPRSALRGQGLFRPALDPGKEQLVADR